MNETQDKFEAWGLLELFGHQRLAGALSEQTIGGCHFIRIDIPECDGVPGYTRLFSNGAIYGMTITTEDIARALALQMRARPIQAYEIQTPRLSSPPEDEDGNPLF